MAAAFLTLTGSTMEKLFVEDGDLVIGLRLMIFSKHLVTPQIEVFCIVPYLCDADYILIFFST